MSRFQFSLPPTCLEAEILRNEVRTFLGEALSERTPLQRAESWTSTDPAFSRLVARRGWIGMTWPTRYGGHERSALERYVVLEEMLAAGAPLGAHWIADRQSGPAILRFGTEAQKHAILPRIARGECFFCIGMSEPDTGSDLASVRTRGVPAKGGFVVNGTKIWTSHAHLSHYMILFCRTGQDQDRHGGFSQFIVDLTMPGISIRPILALTGEHHFNEVALQDVFLPETALLGQLGDGWNQVVSELAFERSGPERFLSSFTLLVELVRALGPSPSEHAAIAIGRLTAHIVTLRRLSRSVAGMLQGEENPALQAALVKDLGAVLEQEISEIGRELIAAEPNLQSTHDFCAVLAYTIMHAPSFSLRGGTREILRGIIARGLGLR